jgi:formamidopyrimidine-DNA glycosylase
MVARGVKTAPARTERRAPITERKEEPMPELPDLTVFAENLDRRLAGSRIAAVHRHGGGGRLNVSPGELSRALTGTTVERIERAGKELCFRIDNGRLLYIHLMLNGGFRLAAQRGQRA